MENISLTHRIVGAIVILSLAIIFIPILLETDQINPGNIIESPVPDIPQEIDSIVFELDQSSGKFVPKNAEEIAAIEQTISRQIEASTQEIELSEAKESKAVATEKPAFPVTIDKPYEHTWMLQLASFKDHDKAINFRDRLRKAGYTSHLDERQFENVAIWRVRVGPYLRKDEAEAVLGKINKAYKVKGILVQRR